jgi:hypothetical protein
MISKIKNFFNDLFGPKIFCCNCSKEIKPEDWEAIGKDFDKVFEDIDKLFEDCGFEGKMNCINCGASTSQYGIYKGGSVIYCTQCQMDFDYRTGEVLLRGTNLKVKRKIYATVPTSGY